MPTASDYSPVSARAAASPPAKRGLRFAMWPLWGAAAAALAFAGTVVFDVRPAAEVAAWQAGEDYTVTSADMMALDHVASRMGWTVGLLGVLALFVFQGYWRRNVEQRFERSVGARIFAGGILATAATLMLGYGWKGALANYLGPESGLYDQEGLFVYYMLTDFGAYLPGFGLVVAALAIVWMAFAERIVSRVLGGVTAVAALFILVMTFGTGVPGLPGVYGVMWLGVAALWLAVGRSRITEPMDAA
jgi:hypothetical protein